MKEIHIGEIILKHRKKKGITQDQLAAYMGVSKTAVSKWETNQSYPDVTFLPVLASYFDISVDTLIGYQPMMDKEEIRRFYYEYCQAFLTKSVEEVMIDLESIAKKYHSCCSLLLHVGLLYINHLNLAKNEQESMDMCQCALQHIAYVRLNSERINERKAALELEGMCYICLKKPLDAIALYNGIEQLTSNFMLANAYLSNQDIDHAMEALEVDVVQALGIVTNSVQLLITLHQDVEKVEALLEKMDVMITLFDLRKLNPGAILQFDIAAFQAYALRKDSDKTYAYIEKFIQHVSEIKSFQQQSNTLFERVDDWVKSQEYFLDLPRDEKVIRKSCYQSLVENPHLAWLREETHFQQLCKRLQTYCE